MMRPGVKQKAVHWTFNCIVGAVVWASIVWIVWMIT